MATPATALMVSTEGAEARAAAAAARAVRYAREASDDEYKANTSSRGPPTDFASLGPAEWNRQGAQSMFKLADGQVVFTGGDDVARRATTEGVEGTVVNIMRAGGAAPEAVEAT
eukprot:1370150-Pleurochrysis_carterae.AAC.1